MTIYDGQGREQFVGNPGADGADGAAGPPGPPLADGDYGDVVVSGSGTAINLDSAVASAAGRAVLAATSDAVQRTALGLGTAATHAHGDYDVAGAAAAAQAAAEAASLPLHATADDSAELAGVTPTALALTLLADSTAAAARTTLGACSDTDSRLSDSRAPSGAAGGALAGTYPNPTLADAELLALAGLTSAADKLPYFTGSGTAALADLSSAARTVLDDATVAAMVDTLGGASSTGSSGLVRKTGPTISTATLKRPTIADAGGDPILEVPVSSVVSPVNYLVASNAATGDPPQVAAVGADTDVAINLVPKGAGHVLEAGVALVRTTDSRLSDSRAPSGAAGGDLAGTYPNPTVGADKVAVAQMHASATDVLFGRSSASAGAGEEVACTAAGRAILDDVSAAAQRTTLGLGTSATHDVGDFDAAGLAAAAAAASLPLHSTADDTTNVQGVTPTSLGLDLLSAATSAAARSSLGLGTLATQSGIFSGTSSGTNTGDQTITLTGDVTGTGIGSFAATIAARAVTYAKLQAVSATDKLLGRSTAGSGDVEEIACTAAGRAILDDADASAQRTTLGLAIGTDVQAYDAELAAIAGLTSAADKLPYFTGSGTAALADLSSAARTVLDDATVAAMVDTLGGASSTGSGGLVRKTSATVTSLILAAGTASASTGPLKFTSGTNLTTAEAGVLEYDGKVFYGSPEASNRGIQPCIYFIRLTGANTLSNSGSAQAIFSNVGAGTLTLPTGTYFFDCLLSLSGMSGTSGNAKIDFLGAGGATANKWLWNARGYDATPAAGNTAVNGHVFAASASGASVVTAAVGTGLDVYCQGMFDVTVAGTIIPSITLVTAVGTVVVAVSSYFRCYCVGAAAVQTVGRWS